MCVPYSADIDTETAARSGCDIDMSVHRPFSARVLLQTVHHMSHAAHAGCLAASNLDLKGKSQDMVSRGGRPDHIKVKSQKKLLTLK